MLVWRVPSLNFHASLQERAAACWWQSLRHHGHNFGHWFRSSSDSCRKGRRSLAIWVSNERMHKRCAFWMDFDGFCDKAGVLVLVSTGTCKMLSVSTLGGCSEHKGSIVGCHILLSLPKCEHLRKLSYWIASLTEWGIHWRPSNSCARREVCHSVQMLRESWLRFRTPKTGMNCEGMNVIRMTRTWRVKLGLHLTATLQYLHTHHQTA